MIRFLDTQTGQPGEVWESQSRMMTSVAYSPGGLEIAVGLIDGELLLYNTITGKPTRHWKAHGYAVTGVTFSPTSQWIATCSWDSTVKVWSAVTGTVLSIFTGHGNSVCQVAFSPNGPQLASCSLDCTMRLWDANSLVTGVDVESGSGPLTSVVFSPDGQVLFTGSKSGALRQYDAVSGETGPATVCRDNPIECLAVSPDGVRIALVGVYVDFVSVWDIGTGQADFVLRGHTEWVSAIAFSADSRWIATGSYDKTVRLWDARSGIQDRVLEGHTYPVECLIFSPNSHRIISGSLDRTIRAWDLESRGCRVVVDTGGLTASWTISTSPDGLKSASLSGKSRDVIKLWDMESGQLQQTLKHDKRVGCLAFSSCGQWMGAALAYSVWLWNFASEKTTKGNGRKEWKCLVRIGDIFGRVLSIAWKPDTLEFGIGCANGSLQVWKLVETPSSSDGWSAQLVWSAGNHVLAASDAVFANAIGLSSVNQQLLTQRGMGAAT
ncbi:WD40 repeat-like protein [Linnemannia elongata AG-77]|uniref:WD40 repeat-like protein n=1 Tax=Linnemannia elongata AG-77 TaxID=1314771 RepID=A0A197JJ67_9FUNG|nr:WD40 repeat-like protein [Linnemannia elongata AG-77]